MALDSQLTGIETQFVDKLENEYKILQDKIDKIGAFRFTIKGWSITVILAAAFASSTVQTPPWLWLISLLLFLALFFIFELEQTKLRYKFGERCILIESAITQVLRTAATSSDVALVRTSFVKLRFVPGITNHLYKKSPGRDLHAWSTWRTYREADISFYIALGLLTLMFAGWHIIAAKREIDRNDPWPGSTIIYSPKWETTQPPQSTRSERQAAVSSSSDRHEPKSKKSK
jgi:hypothetical protein